MNQTFYVREDWVESKLRNETRRTILATSTVVALSLGVGWFSESWIPLVVCAFAMAFCGIQFTHLPSRRKIFGSLRIKASDSGLTFGMPGDGREVFYPWAKITYQANANDEGSESITIGQEGKPGSTELGIENMSDLVAILESKSIRRGVT